jgi:hypothetical protein
VSPFYNLRDGTFILHDHPNWSSPHLDSAAFGFTEGATYNVKIRVEQTDLIDRSYFVKVWAAGTAEPGAWLLEGTDQMTEPLNGAFVLIAHHWDVTFHDIEVAEIVGDDIVKGRPGADVLVGVTPGGPARGVGEIDVLQGGAGADVFVLGDTAGRCYDDGNPGTGGTDDYACVWDFQSGSDRIQLAGAAADYTLAQTSGALPGGTGIYASAAGGPNELIGIVRGASGLSLTGTDFIWVEDTLV